MGFISAFKGLTTQLSVICEQS